MQKPKIAVVHPPFGWGGSDAVALWTIAALKDDYDVSLLTNGDVDIHRMNEFHGTSLSPAEFSVVQIPFPVGVRQSGRLAALKGRFIQRYCQRVASSYDIMVSAYNPCVFGARGIQLVADIEELTAILPLHSWKRWWYGNTPLRRAYLKLCDWISPVDLAAWRDNLTLANSAWTADLMRRKYGVEADVLYPPVSGFHSDTPLTEREVGFVCIGRIIPEKRIETIVEILEGVRERGHDVHLHVVGSLDGKNPYARRLQQDYLERYPDWVTFEGRIDEGTKNELIGRHSFGISGRTDEPFGIAVAEMVSAGCIVFVPGNGGQCEIVNHPDLSYKDVPDAVDQIDKMLRDPGAQDAIREHLSQGVERFSVENFKRGIKKAVSDVLQGI